ncbi:MAG TPA: CBS domain-containing protein [Streptosporangiaceae bacterium]
MPGGPGSAAVLRDLMNATVFSTTPETSVTEAAAGMVRARVGSAVVMQGSFLAGILTERDVLRAAASAEDLLRSPVSAWMTSDPQSAGPDTTAEDAAQLMLLHGFRHLPVVEGRRVLGVVSLRDLFGARIRRPPAG